MSYPDQRYFGDKGEVSATFRLEDTHADLVSGTTRYRYLATGASTDGDFGLYRVDMGADPTGPSEHFHKTMSGSFFILSGTMRLFDGRRWIDAVAGDYQYVPPGGLHAFRNESGEPASMLLLFAPGGPRETYFEEVGHLGQLSDEQQLRFLVRHDSYFTDRMSPPGR